MSFRAFKRLFGETSLERKCRLLLGIAVVVLISISFWLYARQTEELAYKQTETTGQLLVYPLVASLHLESSDRQAAMKDFLGQWEEHGPEELKKYHYYLLKREAKQPQQKPNGPEAELFKEFTADESKQEDVVYLRGTEKVYYYAAIRAAPSCLTCHPRSSEERQ